MTTNRWQYIAIGTAVAIMAVCASLYGMLGRTVHAFGVPPASLAPFTAAKNPTAVPQVAFNDAGGKRVSLASFKGRYVLLNLWAPWCAPCVKELPALAQLKGAVSASGFDVIAVDIGRGTVGEARSFLDAHGARGLETYVDSDLALLRAFGSFGLPLTILIDPQGREIGRALGPARWNIPESFDYFRALAAAHAAS